MRNKDFKNLSLNQLKGNWGKVIGAIVLAYLAIFAISTILQIPSMIQNRFASSLSLGTSIFLLIIALIFSFITIAIGGCFGYGMCKYFLNFVRTGNAELSYIFTGFSYGSHTIMRSFVLSLLMSIFVFLWSLLLIIPGIIATYRYKQAFFILADDDNITPREALRASSEMMNGHKWELFVLELSFIGWIFLTIITFGIGFIFLVPYMETAYTNYYEYLRGIYEGNKNTVQAA